MNLQQYRPTTLAAMIADTSQYLAAQYAGSNVISAQEWDALHAERWRMIDALDAILMEAGADPAVIYEGAPA